MLRRSIRIVGLLIVIGLTVSLSYNALTYINFDPHYGFLRLKQEAIRTGWYLPFYYSHVLMAALILLIGLFQLSGYARKTFPRAHRFAGYFYVIGILFFAAPGGLIMSFFINRGPIVLTSFLFQTAFWFYCTAAAIYAVWKRDFERHRIWMWRSYALTFSAVMLRLYILLISGFVNLDNPTAYGILSWVSWVPNLFFVQFLVKGNVFQFLKHRFLDKSSVSQ